MFKQYKKEFNKFKRKFNKKLKKVNLPQLSVILPVVVILLLVSGGYAFAQYKDVAKGIDEAKNLIAAEEYDDAQIILDSIENDWVVVYLGLQKEKIQHTEDQIEYQKAEKLFAEGNKNGAIELFAKVSATSPFYQSAQSKIKSIESELIDEKIDVAVNEATEDAELQAKAAQRQAQNAQNKAQSAEEKVEETKKELSEAKKESSNLQNQINQLKTQQTNSGYKASTLVSALGKYVVKVGCFNEYGGMSTGSGVIFANGSDGETVILTNYHITENADFGMSYPCIVLYSEDPTQSFTDYYFVEPVSYQGVSLSTMKYRDFDFLSVGPKFRFNASGDVELISYASRKIGTKAPVVCSSSDVGVGEDIVVLGYPAVGGNYMSASEGIISGYDGSFYLTTSAKIEQGNSGGAAFLKSEGCWVGMPTFVKAGQLESWGRLISMPVLEHYYLSKIW